MPGSISLWRVYRVYKAGRSGLHELLVASSSFMGCCFYLPCGVRVGVMWLMFCHPRAFSPTPVSVSFSFSSLPFLNSSSFHSFPHCKKWDMVAPNRQCTVHINENYFWECEQFFRIWNLTLGLKFPSCFLPGVRLPCTAVTGQAKSRQRPSEEACDLPFLRPPYRACCQSQAWSPQLTAHFPLLSRAAVSQDHSLQRDG